MYFLSYNYFTYFLFILILHIFFLFLFYVFLNFYCNFYLSYTDERLLALDNAGVVYNIEGEEANKIQVFLPLLPYIIVSIAAGCRHYLALTAQGKVCSW